MMARGRGRELIKACGPLELSWSVALRQSVMAALSSELDLGAKAVMVG